MTKLYIGRSVWRQEETQHVKCMIDLVRYLDANKIDFIDGTVPGDALISRSRSIVASCFLRSDADVLIQIDTDIVFKPEDVVRIAHEAERHGVACGLYMTRNIATQPAALLPDSEITFAPGRPPVEVPFGSTGFMAIHRRVFKRLAEDLPLCHQTWESNGQSIAFWPFYMPYVIEWPVDGYMYLSEDWAFCQRAKDAGFKVFLDPSIRLGHVGSYTYTLEDLARPPRSAPAPMQLRRGEDGTLDINVPSSTVRPAVVADALPAAQAEDVPVAVPV